VSITITIKYQHSLKMALKTFTTADGSANQALVTNGSGVLSFAAVGASAGQVIQVVTATDSTQRSTSSTSFVTASNTLSVTITPSSASNKIFIIITATGYANAGGVDAIYTIFRDATDLGAASNKGIAIIYNGGNDSASPCGISILDSPNTTSAITYQLYMRNASGGGNITYINYGASKGSITCMEIKG
jgi:hypothetical protein